MLAYSKRKNQIFVTEYINRNWRIMIFKFIDITQIDWKYQSLSLRAFDVSRSFLSIRSEFFSTGFNSRVIAHFKHSSSSLLRLIIAFLLLETLEAAYKRNRPVAHTLRCEDPDSKLNGISN